MVRHSRPLLAFALVVLLAMNVSCWPPRATTPPSPQTPIPPPSIQRTGPTPTPGRFELDIAVAMPRQVYLPGDTIDVKLSFINKDSVAGVLSPFPPAIKILMPSLPGADREPDREIRRTVQTFDTGNETVTLGPGETKTYDFKWDQKKIDGGQATPGWYRIVVIPTGRKASYSGTIRDLSRSYANFLIQYPQGAMYKTIHLNLSQTVTGLPFPWGQEEKRTDVTITLQRVEMTADTVSFTVLVTAPKYPLHQGLEWIVEGAARYTVDGITKDAGISYKTGSPENGVQLQWNPGNLDPIPSDAKKLTFTITRLRWLNNWEGPWEFTIPLQ
ncbi:MAG: hypothetical protein HY665_03185 [Chloroflexi bacterium]|nr:hypothetical protein [Chloroflexota bacterium]